MPAMSWDLVRDFLRSHTPDEMWERIRTLNNSRTMGESEAHVRKIIADHEAGKTLSEMDELLLFGYSLWAVRIGEQPDFYSASLPPFDNYLRGLKSPDKAQQARFKALESALRGATPGEMLAALPALERAKKSAGRKKGSGIDDNPVLLKMHTMVGKDGLKIRQAARKLASKANTQSPDPESTAKRLERKYRKKYCAGEK